MIYPIHTLQIYFGRNYTYTIVLDTQDPYNILMIIKMKMKLIFIPIQDWYIKKIYKFWYFSIINHDLFFTMRNCVRWNHITLQLKLKKNSYIIVMQLFFEYWKYSVIILLEI
jgi:hypothetical protein